MKIEYEQKLDFNNVLIRPKRSTLSSRSQVSLEREFHFPHSSKIWKGVPVISANMDTTGTFEVYNVLSKHKVITALHKFYTLEDYKEAAEKYELDPDYFMVSTGITETNYKNLKEILSYIDATWICIDVANGYMEAFVKYCARIRNEFPDKIIVAGNVVSREMTEELILNGKVDVVKCGIGPGCFSGNTRILMSNGSYKDISEIKEGEYVINKNGKSVKVLNVINKGFRETMKVRMNNWHSYTNVTPDHNYWVGDLSTSCENSLSSSGKAKLLDKKTRTKESKYKWMSLDDINKSSCLLMPKNIEWSLDDNIEIDLELYCKNGNIYENEISTTKTNRFNRYLKSNYNLGYIFGTFLGDGNSKIYESNYSGSSHWSFDKYEREIGDKLINCIKTELNYDCSSSIKSGNVLSIHCYNKCLTGLLYEFGKRENKHLPSKYYCKNKEYIKGIFDGLIDSDGTIEITKSNNKIYTLSNTSKKILELFYWCCINLGISYSVALKEKSIGTLKNANINNLKDCYRIKTHTMNRFTKDYVYSEVFSKELEKEKQQTWDIEVDCDTHSFIANNSIVHNSACTTRLKTGVGMPQLSAIIECSDAAHGVGGFIIGDGGITCPGDMAKAFGGGADFVMCGGVFSGHDENPGDLIEEDGQKYKMFYGMSSELAMTKHFGSMAKYRSSEGRVLKVKYKGPLEKTIMDYLGGLRSCCTYINSSCIKHMPKCTTFVMVSQQLNTSLVNK